LENRPGLVGARKPIACRLEKLAKVTETNAFKPIFGFKLLLTNQWKTSIQYISLEPLIPNDFLM